MKDIFIMTILASLVIGTYVFIGLDEVKTKDEIRTKAVNETIAKYKA